MADVQVDNMPSTAAPAADVTTTASSDGAQVSADAPDDQPSAAPEAPAMSPEEEEELLKQFFSELKDVDRDNEVNRVLWAFKLNPFEKLNLHFNATVDEIRRQYRKVSLMVHPDKCKHPQARDAFEVLGAAQEELLNDEKRADLLKVLESAKEAVRKDRKKATKHDAALRVQSMVHADGRQGIEAEWESTEEFHEKWKLKARDLIAQSEWRKRKMSKRMHEETLRIEGEQKQEREVAKRLKEHEKKWEAERETRVGGWRDFVKKGGKKKANGEIKPPKLKTNDEDKLYVQRPVGEQFRPPPAKPPKRK